jgi:thioredoxin 1
MPAIHVSDTDFEEVVLKSTLPVLVDFYAEWCGPCKMAAPIIDEMAEEYDGKVVIVKLDVDQNQETAGKFGVMSIPTMVLFKDGKELERKVGFGGRTGIESLIKQAN